MKKLKNLKLGTTLTRSQAMKIVGGNGNGNGNGNGKGNAYGHKNGGIGGGNPPPIDETKEGI